jgi:hypothetical protein
VILPQLDPPTSSNPAAALFHRLRLVPLLPGSGGILGLSHEIIINVKIIGLEGIPGLGLLGIPHLRIVPIPIV